MQRLLRNYHIPLLCAFLGLLAMGTLFIHSAAHYQESNFVGKQMFWIACGLTVVVIVSHINYRIFIGTSYLLYGAVILMLLAVFAVGVTRFGATRWLQLGPFVIQPSEFAKLATVLALANFLGSYQKWESERVAIFKALAITALPVVLIMRQPDLGTSLLFMPMIVVLLYLWGIRYRYLIGTMILGVIGMPILWALLKEYQKKRIMVFLNPELDPLGAGYTALQSRIAVGSGGLFGKGYLEGTQGQLNFIPEHHTDFIFCVIGEEWGFLGAVILLSLYGFLFKAIFEVMESTTDEKAKLLAAGIMTIIFTQVFINIGMSFGLMPITGLTLPLISYGGSSFITTCLGIGLILSIYRERSIF